MRITCELGQGTGCLYTDVSRCTPSHALQAWWRRTIEACSQQPSARMPTPRASQLSRVLLPVSQGSPTLRVCHGHRSGAERRPARRASPLHHQAPACMTQKCNACAACFAAGVSLATRCKVAYVAVALRRVWLEKDAPWDAWKQPPNP